jgi:two-component system, NtrC family, response regulator HupR/HoxA
LNVGGSQLNPVPRELRRPLFVPVATNPQLLQCWSENISARGIGVVGRLGPDGETPSGRIELSFQLPDGAAIEAVGDVAWARHTARDTVALGIALTEVAPPMAQRLARFVAEFRLRVIVVGASPSWRERLDEAIGDLVSLEHVDLEEEVPPFDVAAVLYYGMLPSPRDRTAVDLSPGCITIGDAPDALLVDAFRTGRLACALPERAAAAAIRSAVFDVCRDSSVRAELRATMLRFSQQPRRGARAGALRDGQLIAESAPMKRTLEQIGIVAPRKVVVLLEGETGSGKEEFAKEVHARSDRAQRPLIVQDCGTLTDTLLDSELFGHVRGAFTGANADHPGMFVIADGGTIFLDEIENTTPALQSKLLRVIETGQIRPVGGTRTRVVDVRVIAATNTNLRAAVAAGRFRADLYYRLSAFPIPIPPLRDRGHDIELLAERLAADAARVHRLPAPSFTDDAMAAIRRHAWPGNVRQLKNAMERAVLLSGDGGRIDLAHLPDELRPAPGAAHGSLQQRVDAFERAEIERALLAADGVLTKAASLLQTNRVTLARKARTHGLALARRPSPDR